LQKKKKKKKRLQLEKALYRLRDRKPRWMGGGVAVAK
jgi:hypothetical protein